jgi:hypothetical protein
VAEALWDSRLRLLGRCRALLLALMACLLPSGAAILLCLRLITALLLLLLLLAACPRSAATAL